MAETTNDETTPEVVEKTTPEAEPNIIARRTIDTDEVSLTQHEKVFVLGALPGGAKPTASNYDHEPNKVATRQYAIQNGLRPTGPVTLKSVTQHKNGRSWVVTYKVPVIPVERGLRASGPDIVTDQDAAAELSDDVVEETTE
jgi:hypothetical protein